MITLHHEGLRALLETLKDDDRPIVSWRDRLGTEAVVFGETIAAAVPGGPVQVASLTRGRFYRGVRRLAVGAMRAGDITPRREVVLVPCGRAELTPPIKERLRAGAAVPVEEFYGSPQFRASLAQARTIAPPSHIRLLSARHGLLTLSDWITRETAEDVPLGHLSDADRRAWGWRVLRELLEDYGSAPRGFLLLGGQLHKDVLLEAWPSNAPHLRLVVAAPVWPMPTREPVHPVLRTLADLHRNLAGERSPVLVWRDDDGTEALAFGRRFFVAHPGGAVQTASLRFQDDHGRMRSVREVAHQLVSSHSAVTADPNPLRGRILDTLGRAFTPLPASVIATKVRRRVPVVRAWLRRLVEEGLVVSTDAGFVMSAAANPFATPEEIVAVLRLAHGVLGSGEVPGAENALRQLAARFAAADRPLVSTLRAVLSDLRAYAPRTEEAWDMASRQLRDQLTRRASEVRRAAAPPADRAAESTNHQASTPLPRRSR